MIDAAQQDTPGPELTGPQNSGTTFASEYTEHVCGMNRRGGRRGAQGDWDGRRKEPMVYVPPEPFHWNFCGACGRELVIAHDGESDRPHCPDCRRFYYRNPLPAACCFVSRGKDELLFAQRGVEPCLGEWTLPGGFIELDETTEEAALRELQEETSLQGRGLQLVGVSTKSSPHGGIIVVGYSVGEWEGELRPAGDVSDLRFFSKAERPPMPFHVHRELLRLYDLREESAGGALP